MKHTIVIDRARTAADASSQEAALDPRSQRALHKADGLLSRIATLKLDLTDPRLDAASREQSLEALEALVLSSRGSSEVDHRKQLVLAGLADAAEAYTVTNAPHAAELAAAHDPDRVLADHALVSLRAEYPEEAALLTRTAVAAAVRRWSAERAGEVDEQRATPATPFSTETTPLAPK